MASYGNLPVQVRLCGLINGGIVHFATPGAEVWLEIAVSHWKKSTEVFYSDRHKYFIAKTSFGTTTFELFRPKYQVKRVLDQAVQEFIAAHQ